MATRAYNGVYTALAGNGNDKYTDDEITGAIALLPKKSYKPTEVVEMVRVYCESMRKIANAPERITRFWQDQTGRVIGTQSIVSASPTASGGPLPIPMEDMDDVRRKERAAVEARACAELQERCARFIQRVQSDAGIYRLMRSAEIAEWDRRRQQRLQSGYYFEESYNPMCEE